jgi:hypothetical protein
MDPRELAEDLKDAVETGRALRYIDGFDGADWGHGDADFFIRTERDGTFLVTVSKVAE